MRIPGTRADAVILPIGRDDGSGIQADYDTEVWRRVGGRMRKITGRLKRDLLARAR